MQGSRPIEIVYEDDYLVIVNKPSGLLVVPTPKKEIRTLTSILNQQCKDRLNNTHLYPCHRLDRDTSGLLIYAKGKKILQLMTEQFRSRSVKKKYIALVHGRLNQVSGTVKNFIEDIPIGGRRFRHTRKMAITRYKVLREEGNYSVVEVEPITGRTNQIRIHFQQLGHPLLGERKYCFAHDFLLKFGRVALHAAHLEFSHPVTKKTVSLSADLPADMGGFIGNR